MSIGQCLSLRSSPKGCHYVGRSIAEAAIHDACSSFNTSQFQSQRAVFQELVRNTMAQRYGEVWADITDLQVRLMRPPFRIAFRIMRHEE